METGVGLTRRDLETKLIEKAWKDPEFRKEVLRDPKGMFEQYLGQKLPEQVEIFVHEEDASTLHFSIPPAPSNVRELSDGDLEKVAGGTDVLVSVVAFAAGMVVTCVGGLTAAEANAHW
jgi:hypothetical protein